MNFMVMENHYKERSFGEQLASLTLGAILSGEDGAYRFYDDKLTGDFVAVGNWSLIGAPNTPPEALRPYTVYGRGKTLEEASGMIFEVYRNRDFLKLARIKYLACLSSEVTRYLFLLWANDNQDTDILKSRMEFYHGKSSAIWSYKIFLNEFQKKEEEQ